MLRVLSTPFVPGRLNVAAAAATAQLLSQPVTLLSVVILTAGSTAITFYDNVAGDTSGTKVGALPAVTTIGQSFTLNIPVYNGLTASGASGTPEYVLTYAPSQDN